MSPLRPCRTPAQLHRWVELFCGLSVPRVPLCPGHAAPFDYLIRSYFEPARDLIVWAPRGGGKTSLAAVATLLDLLHKPGCSVRILGGSLEQSLKMWEYLLPHVERVAPNLLTTKRAASSRRLRLSTTSDAAVLTQSQRAVRGLRVQKLRCDEVELFDPDIWEAAQLVTKSKPMTDATPAVNGAIEALSTLHNAHGLMSRIVSAAEQQKKTILKWCLLDVLERCPPERACDSCALFEDCGGAAKNKVTGFVSIDDALAMKRRVSVETWQAEMLCRRPSVRGCVFPNFDPDTHVSLLEPVGEVTLAIDFGFSNPFVCLWLCKTPGGQTHVLDEYVQPGKTIHEHVVELKRRAWPSVRRIACDPAGAAASDQTAQSNVDVLRQAGYAVRHRPSRIVDGIELVRTAMRPAAGPPALFVHPRCVRLVTALGGYRYPDHPSELPLKDGVHDHLIDALRYHYICSVTSAAQVRRY